MQVSRLLTTDDLRLARFDIRAQVLHSLAAQLLADSATGTVLSTWWTQSLDDGFVRVMMTTDLEWMPPDRGRTWKREGWP